MSGNVTGNVTAIIAYLRAKVNFFKRIGGKGDLLKNKCRLPFYGGVG
jgi:hypothetical protein